MFKQPMTETRTPTTFPSLEFEASSLFESWCLRFGAFALMVAAAFLAGPSDAFAAGGTVMTLPQPGTKIRSGLAMTLDLRGIDANGYRPVTVTVQPLNGLPLPADRVLRVVLKPYAYMGNITPEVSQVIELPEGSTVTTATIAMPQSSQWHSFEIETFEDGEKLRDLSIDRFGVVGMNYWEWTEARPATLIVDRGIPDRPDRDKMITDFKSRGTDTNRTFNIPEPRLYANLFPELNRTSAYFPGGQRLSDAELLDNLLTNYPRLEMLPPSELPKRWIELSQYDIVMIPLADLRLLAKNEPERLRALADWAAGGPLLIVHGVGSDFAGLAEIDKLLALPPLADATSDEFRSWTPAQPEHHLAVMRYQMEDFDEATLAQMKPTVGYRYVNPVVPEGNPGYKRGQPKPNALPVPADAPFAMRPIGLGQLVAIASDNPFPGDRNDWIWIFNSVPRSHWMWYQRNGYSLHRENADYWTFLIPGVGEAPALSFLILVSLFAVVIGPVNYLLLGKTGRYYLLLITVPLGALLVTGGLFFYAIATDGLGVKLRARSFTDLDQASGRAVAWSRQSYYASIAPSRGLTFPSDATVFPILYQPGQRFSGGERPDNTLVWDETQNLTRGYITSRTTTQFMVLRVTKSADKLQVTEGRSASQPPQVTNQLKTDIRLVILRDRGSQFWQGSDVQDGASAVLTAITAEEAAKKLTELYGKDPPANPEGYDPTLHNTAFSMFMPNYGWNNVDASSTQPVMAASLLEKNLAHSTRPGDLAPGSYLAVTRSSPVAASGVPSVREEASLHVVRGRY
jgi:hypothetical protein